MEADRTILFADVCDSTRIAEILGDAQSHRHIDEILDELAETARKRGGTLIKTIGDEVMLSFESPEDGVLAAIDMQVAVSTLPPIGSIRTAIKVGLNAGPVVVEDDDLFGDVVNVAARVASMAVANQILTTGATIERISNDEVRHRVLGRHGVRGRAEPIRLHEILWGPRRGNTTLLLSFEERPTRKLRVVSSERTLTLSGDSSTPVSLGRGPECSLVVSTASASRAHADLVARGGLFFLEDHSTNGTYIRPDGAPDIYVHRARVVLVGSGRIRFGQPIGDNGSTDIEYRIL